MSIEAAAVKLRELRDSEMAVGRGPKPMGEDYEWIDAVIAAFVGDRALYEAVLCPSARGVIHDGCDYRSHIICNKCGWIDDDHDGCLHGMVFVQTYPEVE